MTPPTPVRETKKNQRGIALLITLAFISVMVATALELNRRMRSTVEATSKTRDLVRAKAMASSGVHAAMALLALDKRLTIVDSVQEIWADPVKLGLLLDEMPFEEGELKVRISDELARIQINALALPPHRHAFDPAQQTLWLNFLDGFIEEDDRGDDFNPTAIVNSIKDWMDSEDDDAITGLNGAESAYYRDLERPYSCANSIFRHESELAMVKGVSEELFRGVDKEPGISEYATPFGVIGANGETIEFHGAVNINTAEASVLRALFGPDFGGRVRELVEYRVEKSGDDYVHDLSDPEWYREVPGFQSARIDPGLVALESDLFRIESAALLNDSKTTVVAVVHRRNDAETGKIWCKVLSWKVK